MPVQSLHPCHFLGMLDLRSPLRSISDHFSSSPLLPVLLLPSSSAVHFSSTFTYALLSITPPFLPSFLQQDCISVSNTPNLSVSVTYSVHSRHRYISSCAYTTPMCPHTSHLSLHPTLPSSLFPSSHRVRILDLVLPVPVCPSVHRPEGSRIQIYHIRAG